MRVTDSIQTKLNRLLADLNASGGPSISSMQNYPFAIFQYEPDQEFELRKELRRGIDQLRSSGWIVEHIDLFQMLVQKLREEEGDEAIDCLIAEEKQVYGRRQNPVDSLEHLKQMIQSDIDSENGISKSINRRIEQLTARLEAKRAVVFITRAGSLFPFHKTSGLLRYLKGEPRLPVILFYPGTRPGDTNLSFMGVLHPEADYRPRIY